MKKTLKLLIISAVLMTGAANAQVLTGCNGCNDGRTTSPSIPNYHYNLPHTPQLIVRDMYAGGRLDSLVRFIESLQGKVDYYTYGEIFLPLKLEIGSLQNIQTVYGPVHQETFKATMRFLSKVDENWSVIANYKNTDMFFETINYFEMVILQLKRDTYL